MKFPKWTTCEVAHEAWIALDKIGHRYDPEKGSLLNWAESNLWDPVNISYCYSFGIKIKRPTMRINGKSVAKPREYQDLWRPINKSLDAVFPSEDGPPDVVVEESISRLQEEGLRLSAKQRQLCELLARGFNQRQCSYALGVHESAVTQMLYTIRKNNATDPRTTRPI